MGNSNNKLIEFVDIHYCAAFFLFIRSYHPNYKDKKTKKRPKISKFKAFKALHLVKYLVDKAFKIVFQELNSWFN